MGIPRRNTVMTKTVSVAAVLAVLMVPLAYGQAGPKVFLDSENPANAQKQSAKIVSLREINERFMKACPDCVVTIKKDSADYVVRFAASQGWGKKSWSWIVHENRMKSS